MSKLNFGSSPFGVHQKMTCHYDRINEYMTTGDTFPIVVEINLTDVCNLNCVYCFCDHRSNFTLDTNTVKKFIRDFKVMGGKAITFSGGGEPTCHKDFIEISEYAHEQGLDLGLISNGVFSDETVETVGTKFKWIRVSLDSVDPELYKTIKGVARLDTALSNIEQLRSYPVKLGINCNVTNDMVVGDVFNFIFTLLLNVDYIQFRPVLPRFIHKESIDINEDVWEHLKTYTDPKIILSLDKFTHLNTDAEEFPFENCDGHFFSPILDSSGDLNVCMYHPTDSNFTFGNINEDSLHYIWNSQQRKDTIQYVREFEYAGKCQMCCKLFEINKFLEFIKQPDKSLDVNFL